MKITKKILDMLASREEEMVKLGMRLALGMGGEWCAENIPQFGIANVKEPPMIKPCPGRNFAMTDGDITICNRTDHIVGIDARYNKDFPDGSVIQSFKGEIIRI